MKITKRRLKNLIQEELASMKEYTGEQIPSGDAPELVKTWETEIMGWLEKQFNPQYPLQDSKELPMIAQALASVRTKIKDMSRGPMREAGGLDPRNPLTKPGMRLAQQGDTGYGEPEEEPEVARKWFFKFADQTSLNASGPMDFGQRITAEEAVHYLQDEYGTDVDIEVWPAEGS